MPTSCRKARVSPPRFKTSAPATFASANVQRPACRPSSSGRTRRLGDTAGTTANGRNRRIFNDPAGLAAGRNLRAYLVQSYARDMGNGKMVMMREIDVPIRVKGRHWGGFRTAYRL